jgi:hypothetical protein
MARSTDPVGTGALHQGDARNDVAAPLVPRDRGAPRWSRRGSQAPGAIGGAVMSQAQDRGSVEWERPR